MINIWECLVSNCGFFMIRNLSFIKEIKERMGRIDIFMAMISFVIGDLSIVLYFAVSYLE